MSTSKNISFFEIHFLSGTGCTNSHVVLELDGKKIPQSLAKLNFKTEFNQLSFYLDFSTEDLKELSKSLEVQQKRYAIYKNYKGQDLARYFSFAQGQRKFHEFVEQKNMIDRIISSREIIYISPVP